MKEKLTQEQRIINKLKSDGEVSNLWAIRNSIWRLGAIICDLKKKGYDFQGEYLRDKKGKLTKVYNYKLI